jgi:hypothetical protein
MKVQPDLTDGQTPLLYQHSGIHSNSQLTSGSRRHRIWRVPVRVIPVDRSTATLPSSLI